MSIGSQLKRARQRKQLSLDEVYKQTRIHPSVLKALEQDKFGQILNSAYIRSFLGKYAAYLGLDTEAILKEYNSLYPKEEAEKLDSFLPGREISLQRIDSKKIKKIAKIIAASVSAILICLFLVRGVGRIIHNISTESAEPRKTAAKKERPAKEIEVVQKSTIRRPAQLLRQLPVPSGEKLKLTITTTDDVWVELKADGKIISQSVLREGISETWEAEEGFTIWTGKAEAMQLKLNGIDLGAPGEGVIRGILVTREGVKRKS